MAIQLRCKAKLHTIRLRDDRLWKRALCPKCKSDIDPTRLRRLWFILREKMSKTRGSSEIPDEIRFANLRWRIDKLVAAAWTSEVAEEFVLPINQKALIGLSPPEITREFLNHISRIAPGLPVPIRIPEIGRQALESAGGTFSSKDGWAVMMLSNDIIHDARAVKAVMAHEVCHYVLNCSGMCETDTESNEKLTDLCMFVFGLGEVFLDGYRSETVSGEYRVGHRLGYLSDAEYAFANRYVRQLRKDTRQRVESSINSLRMKILARVGDERVVERLIESERRRSPNKSKIELYKDAYESLDYGRV